MMRGLIERWHRGQLDADYGMPSGIRLVMGCPVWGDPFVSRFLDYCLPTIRANQDALDAVGWAFVLFVDEDAERRLRPHLPATAKLVRLPAEIMDGLYREPGHKYALLAAVHNLLIFKAKSIGAGFHMTVADTVYSHDYFRNLMRLAEKHDAIHHTGFAIVATTGLPALEDYRLGDRLVMTARQLGAIGWEHLNPQWASWTMNGIEDFAEMPNSHYIHWRGRSSVHIHCAHQSAAWIGPDRCQKVKPSIGGTVDSELPRYMAGPAYAPRLEDGLAYLVIAGASEPTPRVPFEEFRAEFWRFIGGSRDFLPYFTTPCPVPVPEDDRYPSETELDHRMARLMAKLEEGRT